jgi:hypothetical protein
MTANFDRYTGRGFSGATSASAAAADLARDPRGSCAAQ